MRVKNYTYFLLLMIVSPCFLLTMCSSNNSGDYAGETLINKTKSGDIFPQKIILTEIVKGLKSPVAMGVAGDGSNRIFICEQYGTIRVFENSKLLPLPFLDISKKIDNLNFAYSEKGLLGIAFHPQYKLNGRFFVYYSAPSKINDSNHKSIVAEYKVSKENKNIADINERIILEIEQPESNHNGGMLAFGKDGYLYISSGDGGGGGDQHGERGNGQNLNTLLGKILCIDVDKSIPYAIPSTNPFVNKNAKPEIYAYGLRNPWRFSFDKKTGQLFCGDVGQNKYEEVDIIEKGKNYGWRITEGSHCYNSDNCDRVGLEYPIDEYPHSVGISVCGGYVYRGSYAAAVGHYIFGDFNGSLFVLSKKENEWIHSGLYIENENTNDIGFALNSFGEDEKGELYILGQHGPGPKNNKGVLCKISWAKK
jgi:glucose/arabinose dehydrogenase